MTLEVAGVRLTAEIGLPTILGDSEDGMTIPEIAAKTSVDGDKLGSSAKLVFRNLHLTQHSKSASFVSSLPRAGSVKQSQVTLQTIVLVILSDRISLDTIWLHTRKHLELLRVVSQLNKATTGTISSTKCLRLSLR